MAYFLFHPVNLADIIPIYLVTRSHLKINIQNAVFLVSISALSFQASLRLRHVNKVDATIID